MSQTNASSIVLITRPRSETANVRDEAKLRREESEKTLHLNGQYPGTQQLSIQVYLEDKMISFLPKKALYINLWSSLTFGWVLGRHRIATEIETALNHHLMYRARTTPFYPQIKIKGVQIKIRGLQIKITRHEIKIR